MNPVRLMIIALGVLAAALFIVIPVSFARRLATDRSARKVRYHAGKALDALKDYTSEQKDEALSQAKATMEQLDENIDALQQKIYNRWSDIDQDTRDKLQSRLHNLSQKRNQLAQWYGSMMQSSSDAWEDVKDGFMNSFKELRDSFQEAQGEFS
jgi:uncharacterized membrane protein YgaE (UPF0421/DUF939 family)